jgi:hypothetical protein
LRWVNAPMDIDIHLINTQFVAKVTAKPIAVFEYF